MEPIMTHNSFTAFSSDSGIVIEEKRKGAMKIQLVTISTQNMDYAQRAYDLATLRFNNGTINSVALMTFQSNYEATMIQHYENLFNRLDTYLEIYKLTGKLGLTYTK